MSLGRKREIRDQSLFFFENINFWKSLPRAPTLNIHHWLQSTSKYRYPEINCMVFNAGLSCKCLYVFAQIQLLLIENNPFFKTYKPFRIYTSQNNAFMLLINLQKNKKKTFLNRWKSLIIFY